MNPETKAALRAASHNLITEAGYAAQSASHSRQEAEAHEKRARGLREAAAVIDAALAEAAARVTAVPDERQ